MSDSPSYIDRLRLSFPDKSEAQLELLCSSSRQLQQITGLSAHEHRKRGMQKLFPSRVWHEWRDQRIKSVQECLENQIKELSWIGSSNSNKTGDMADIALSLWWTRPEMTSIYIASPYEKATEDGVWAEILMQFEEAKQNNPALPGRHRLSDNSIVMYDKNPKSFIKVATVDQVGKLVGKKSRDPSQGLMVIIVDEIVAFQLTSAVKFLSVCKNLWSVHNILILAAGNFAMPSDGLGIFCDPDERDIPGGYDAFDPDRHFRWRTKRKGLCLRFDGLQSPNVKAGRDVYPFLTTLSYIDLLASQPGGLKSPDAMRYIRSAPVLSLDEFTITNSDRIIAGGATQPFVWTSDPVKKGAFCDAGMGGDDCVIQKFMLGWEALPTGGRRQVFALWEEPYILAIEVGKKDENGVVIPADTQVVLGTKAYCRKFRIPDEHVGYDGSMRASLAQKFGTEYGAKVVPIDSGGVPTDRKVNSREDITWKDKVDRLLSEMWFALASAIDSFQLRGLELSPRAAEQLKTRRWEWTGGKGKGKKRVETKLEYKKNLAKEGKPVRSPGESDALVGCMEMARRMGFSLEGVAPKGGSAALLLQMIEERQRKSAYHHIPGMNDRQELPHGRLHAMNREQSSLRHGRLNRQVL